MANKQNVNPILIKIGLVIGVVVLGFVITLIYQETKQKQQKQAVIDALIAEKNQIDKDNSMMQEKLAYYSSSEYAEKKSKELNMQKPDEHLIVVRPSIVRDSAEEIVVEPIKKEVVEKITPNYKKWWNYLFKY